MTLRITGCHLNRMVFVSTCTACLILHVNNIRQGKEQREKLFGRFTDQQMFRRAQSLCLLLLPNQATVRMSAETATAYSPKKSPEHYWDLNCLDGNAGELAHYRWDADTGELLLLACSSSSSGLTTPGHIKRAEALWQAHRWLELLYNDLDRKWRIEPDIIMAKGFWIIVADKGRRHLHIELNGSNGSLRCVMVY